MGYTTEFNGSFKVTPSVEKDLADYINRFSSVRHMKRDNEKIKLVYPNWKDLCYNGNLGKDGEYLAIHSNDYGQEDTPDIMNYNWQPETQPGLWCQWIVPENDLSSLKWDEGEKFYMYEDWLKYLINNFLKPNGYVVNGVVDFEGEDERDFGCIIVDDNEVRIEYGEQC